MENIEQVKETEQLGAYQLAHLAGTNDPTGQDSPGAKFLKSVRDMIIESYLEEDLTEVTFNEIISNSPSIWYSEVMDEYNDLSLWKDTDLQNYIEQIKEDKINITDIAAIQLIDVAYRLGYAILEKLEVEF